jgi:cytochrome P450
MANKPPYEIFTELSKMYGPICSINAAGIEQIILSDWEVIRDVFNKPEFSGRPSFFSMDVTSEGGHG